LRFEFRLFRSILAAGMKKLFRTALLALIVVTVTSCAYKARVIYHAGDETPPDFLAGPVAVLLTNIDGFSATLTASTPLRTGEPHQVSGDLLEREGRLIFQPATGVKGKHKRSEGGMFFIWHEDKSSGFVLSDPLQAYAPIASSVQVTNIIWNPTGAIQEPANGHPCRRLEATVQSSDGLTARYFVWQAEDAKRSPVRIASADGVRGLTLNLTNVRMDLPAPELFYPPDGFTRYETPTALMNELIVRQSVYVKSQNISQGEGEPVPANGPANWRPSTTH
jgi:hypothetical protein